MHKGNFKLEDSVDNHYVKRDGSNLVPAKSGRLESDDALRLDEEGRRGERRKAERNKRRKSNLTVNRKGEEQVEEVMHKSSDSLRKKDNSKSKQIGKQSHTMKVLFLLGRNCNV